MKLPTLFSGKDVILQYDYDKIDSIVGSEIDHYEFIENLSVPNTKNICKKYFKSIMMGYNHVFIDKLMNQHNTNSNICLPLLHQWLSNIDESNERIDNLIIINDPDDAERICKDHIKKAPIFSSFYTIVLSLQPIMMIGKHNVHR